jgi:hypothetical protein
MKEPKFTPGPWTYDGKFTVGIPHVSGDTYFRTNPEDARLIVVAPKLYEAARRALNYIHDIDGTSSAVWEDLFAALNEARGES